MSPLIFTLTLRRPLDGLRIFITHIKVSLIPHPTGKCANEIIMSELQALEDDSEGGLGVEFVEVKKGDRLCGSLVRMVEGAG
jgi:cAMP phosphodiesterase